MRQNHSSKVKALSNALKRPLEEQAQLPEATDDVEILYHRLLENQSIARSESESSAAIRQSQMRDYYSMWVHQIKTPISAMKLLLEAEREELGQLICDDEQSQCHIGDMTGGNIGAALKQQAALTELSDNVASFEDELFRIEEYVSMALQYQRVSSTENDFVLEKVSVDGVIRDTIKKYAKIMIRRHIGIIPKAVYQVQLINGEKQGLTIKLSSSQTCVMINFGMVQAVRMLDEGIVQSNLYSENEIRKYKDNDFQNIIYEVQDGEFSEQINQISDGYGEALNLKHYVVITQNYNIDIVTEWEPTIEISKM